MLITNKQKEHIVNFGSFKYDAATMASILDLDVKDVKAEIKNKSSEFSMLYQKGINMSEYVIDQKLFELAQEGDLNALEKHEERAEIRKRRNR